MILNSFNLTKLFWFSLTFRLNGPLWIVRSAFWLDGPLFDLDGPNSDFVPLLDVLVQFFSVLQLLVKRQEFRILLLGGGEVSRMLSLCYKVSRAEGVIRCFFPIFEHPTVLLHELHYAPRKVARAGFREQFCLSQFSKLVSWHHVSNFRNSEQFLCTLAGCSRHTNPQIQP